MRPQPFRPFCYNGDERFVRDQTSGLIYHRVFNRVLYADTDRSGIVYHANYLQFAERARTEVLRDVGLQQSQLRADYGILLTVRRLIADFLAPAQLDDRLVVATRLLKLRGASLDVEQIIRRDSLELVKLHVKLACATTAGRATRLPDRLRTALASVTATG